MKKLILSLILTLSTLSFASGKLSLENQYFLNSKTVAPILGFTIYEPLVFGLTYNSWHGGGLSYESKWWVTSKNDLDIGLNDDLTLSIGATYRMNPHNESDVHVGLSYNLW